jgi:hypothetical protein
MDLECIKGVADYLVDIVIFIREEKLLQLLL